MTMNAILSAKNYASPGTKLHTITWSIFDAYSAIAVGTGAFAAFGTAYVLPASAPTVFRLDRLRQACRRQSMVQPSLEEAYLQHCRAGVRREHWLARLELWHCWLG